MKVSHILYRNEHVVLVLQEATKAVAAAPTTAAVQEVATKAPAPAAEDDDDDDDDEDIDLFGEMTPVRSSAFPFQQLQLNWTRA